MALSPSRPLLLGCALALAGCSDDGTGTGAATDSSSTSLSTVGSTGNATNTTQPTTSTTQSTSSSWMPPIVRRLSETRIGCAM